MSEDRRGGDARLAAAFNTLAAGLPPEVLAEARRRDPFPLLLVSGADTGDVAVPDFGDRVQLADAWQVDPDDGGEDREFVALLRKSQWSNGEVLILWLTPPLRPKGYVWKLLVPEEVI
jgi:hypothetical protein